MVRTPPADAEFPKLPWQDDLPPDLDMVEIRGRLKEEDYTPYAAWNVDRFGWPTSPVMVEICVKDGKTWKNLDLFRMIWGILSFCELLREVSQAGCPPVLEHGN